MKQSALLADETFALGDLFMSSTQLSDTIECISLFKSGHIFYFLGRAVHFFSAHLILMEIMSDCMVLELLIPT